jgi:hypothetical protein
LPDPQLERDVDVFFARVLRRPEILAALKARGVVLEDEAERPGFQAGDWFLTKEQSRRSAGIPAFAPGGPSPAEVEFLASMRGDAGTRGEACGQCGVRGHTTAECAKTVFAPLAPWQRREYAAAMHNGRDTMGQVLHELLSGDRDPRDW